MSVASIRVRADSCEVDGQALKMDELSTRVCRFETAEVRSLRMRTRDRSTSSRMST